MSTVLFYSSSSSSSFFSSFEDRARDRERRSRWPEEERNARAWISFFRLKMGKSGDLTTESQMLGESVPSRGLETTFGRFHARWWLRFARCAWFYRSGDAFARFPGADFDVIFFFLSSSFLRPADKSHSFLSFFLSFRADTKTARSVDTSPPVTVELGNIASTQLVAVWRVVSTTTES